MPVHSQLLMALACLVFTLPVQAEERDPVAAEALYKRGRDLLAEGKQEQACEKFQASLDLNPRVTTLLNLARCSEGRGELVKAVGQYRRAKEMLAGEKMSARRQAALKKLAEEGEAALRPKIAVLRIVVVDAPTGVQVTRSGESLPRGSLGEELPTDPGDHEIVVTAPGYQRVTRNVTLAEGGSEEVEITLVAKPITPEPAPTKPDSRTAIERVPIWTWVVGGVGLALVGAGIGFKLDADDAEQTLDDMCGPERICDPDGGYDPADDNARKDRGFWLFVVGMAAGGAALAASVVGISIALTSDDQEEVAHWHFQPWAGPTSVGGMMWGTF